MYHCCFNNRKYTCKISLPQNKTGLIKHRLLMSCDWACLVFQEED